MSDSQNPPAPPPKKAGAPLGNANALKHGFYSKASRFALPKGSRANERNGLEAIPEPATLENEIQLMRVFILRTAKQKTDGMSLPDMLSMLDVLSRASLSIGSMLRVQRFNVDTVRKIEFEQAMADLRTANTRAQRLIDRLAGHLDYLDEACAGASEDEIAADEEYCDIPADCATCAEVATCPDAPHPRIVSD